MERWSIHLSETSREISPVWCKPDANAGRGSRLIGHRVTWYFPNRTLFHGLQLADALVAATAVERGESLLTADLRHCRFLREISLERYRPEG